ncbi:MAG: N-acetyltransferase [Planctomycetes bacterium]|nr:N-acetyltransferase [Planctomycetota bacterium]
MSIVHPSAKIGKGTTIGEFTVIEQGVRIGKDCRIGHNVVLKSGTRLGHNVRVDEHTVIGKLPMRASRSATTTERVLKPAQIGDNTLIGAGVIIYRGCQIGKKVLVADMASIREDVDIGAETIIGRGVTVENKCSVGKRCKVETEVYICALSSIADYCFIAPEVTFTNDNFVGRTKERFKHFKGVTMLKGARVGANSTILPGLTIGADALVAAGSVVTRDVPPETAVKGAPAKPYKKVPFEQLLSQQP